MGNLTVSTSPHIRSAVTTQSIMRDVLIALAPATVAAVVLFGLRALLLVAVSVATCVLGEFLFNLICKKQQTIGDLSAVVTGVILALNLNTKVTVWQMIVGALFAIVVVKCFFGGIGCNFANPAATLPKSAHRSPRSIPTLSQVRHPSAISHPVPNFLRFWICLSAIAVARLVRPALSRSFSDLYILWSAV